jgi:lipopolysaccharide export system permease protein
LQLFSYICHQQAMKFKKLDIYITRKFLGTFFFAIVLIIIIVIVFDISEKIDDFLEKDAPLKAIIFDYYMNFIPYFANMFSPLFTFIAVIYFTSRLASNTEIVALLSSGISFRRILVPYIASAIIIAIFSFVLSNFLIPPANKKRIEFELTYIKSLKHSQEMNVHMQISPGVFAYSEHFNSETNMAYHFSLEKISEKGLEYKLTSDNAQYDSSKGAWHIQNYFVRTIDGMNEYIKSGTSKDTVLNIKPSDFVENLHNIETMNYSELNTFIADEKLKGSDSIQYYLVEKHKRIAFPFATVVLTLIGVSLSSRKKRGGIGLNLGIGLTLSFIFILFMQISTTFATNGNLPAQIAVWIPNIFFGALGLFLIRLAPK